MRATDRLARIVLVGYLVLLAGILLWPDGHEVGLANTGLHRLVIDLGAPAWVGPNLSGFAANIVLLVPLGLAGALARPRVPALGWAAVGLLVGSAAEVTQALLLPTRTPSVADVVANALGVVLGALLARVVARVTAGAGVPRRRRPRRSLG